MLFKACSQPTSTPPLSQEQTGAGSDRRQLWQVQIVSSRSRGQICSQYWYSCIYCLTSHYIDTGTVCNQVLHSLLDIEMQEK